MAIENLVEKPIFLIDYANGLPDGAAEKPFVETFAEESDVLRALPFMAANMGIREATKTTELPAVRNRAFNEPGNESTGKFELFQEDTFLMDEYIKVDRAMIDRFGSNYRSKQERLKTIAMAQHATRIIMNGDNSSEPREADGLKARAKILDVDLFNNSVAAGGAPLSLVNLDTVIRAVRKPTHIIMPRTLMPFWDAAARNPGLTNAAVTTDKDDLGRKVVKYQNIPILYGYEPDDSPDLLGFTEVGAGGGAAVTGSIYVVSFSEDGFFAIEQTPLAVKDEGMLAGIPFMSTHIKWDWGLMREHPRSIARLTSITKATIAA
jgi:hypothetical protein